MLRTTLVLVVAAAVGAAAAIAAQCPVPSGPYPTIQAAIDTPTCTEILVAAGLYEESPVIDRDLVLTGDSSATTTIGDQLEVDGAAVALAGLTISGGGGSATEALWSHSGAEVTALDVLVTAAGAPAFFADGFESGDTSAWARP
jgi:nitrous oxidase accessory protein NosD